MSRQTKSPRARAEEALGVAQASAMSSPSRARRQWWESSTPNCALVSKSPAVTMSPPGRPTATGRRGDGSRLMNRRHASAYRRAPVEAVDLFGAVAVEPQMVAAGVDSGPEVD